MSRMSTAAVIIYNLVDSEEGGASCWVSRILGRLLRVVIVLLALYNCITDKFPIQKCR